MCVFRVSFPSSCFPWNLHGNEENEEGKLDKLETEINEGGSSENYVEYGERERRRKLRIYSYCMAMKCECKWHTENSYFQSTYDVSEREEWQVYKKVRKHVGRNVEEVNEVVVSSFLSLFDYIGNEWKQLSMEGCYWETQTLFALEKK